MSQRTNPIDTETEALAEIKESLDSIVDDIDEVTLRLRDEDLHKIINDLDEAELHEVLHRLFQLAPEDVKRFSLAIETAAGNNLNILREIILSVADNGLLPESYLTGEIAGILFNEIFADDPEYIQQINRVERVSDILALRYRLHELLISEYLGKHPDAAAFDFENLATSKTEDDLIISLENARADITSAYEDYVIEYQLGEERDYELEEMIFLAKKILYIGKSEGKKISDGLEERLQDDLAEYNQKSYKVQDISAESTDFFSFHQIKILGGDYNFAYFDYNASQQDFFTFPQLGEKPVMLLLHGISRDWAFWRNMVKTLIPYYQIIVPDMNGYGDSSELVNLHSLENYSNYIASFLNKLGVQDFSIMGHSLGSFTTQQVLANRGLNPQKAVLFSSAPYIELPAITKFLGDLTTTFATNLLGKVMANVPPSVESLTSGHDRILQAEDNYYTRVIKKASPRAIAEAVKFIAFDYHFEEYLTRSEAEYLIVAADNDRIIPAKATLKLLDFFPNSKFILIKDSGHDEVVNRFLERRVDVLEEYLGHSLITPS